MKLKVRSIITCMQSYTISTWINHTKEITIYFTAEVEYPKE